MGLLRDSYSFADFTNLWAKEQGRDPADVAALLAEATMGENGLKYNVCNPQDPGPSQLQAVPFRDDPDWQEFDAAVSDHLHRLAQGSEPPDLAERLRYVSLERDVVKAWFSSRGEAMPTFWRTDEPAGSGDDTPAGANAPSAREFRNLQKLVAVLVHLLAERAPMFRRGDNTNVAQICDAIDRFRDARPEMSEALRSGLGRSTVHEKISEALRVLDEDR